MVKVGFYFGLIEGNFKFSCQISFQEDIYIFMKLKIRVSDGMCKM